MASNANDIGLSHEELARGYGLPASFDFDPNMELHRVDSGTTVASVVKEESGKKRPAPEMVHDNSKKRFVWPDALHRDFMAAVFDIGLQQATAKEVLALMGPSDVPVSNEQLSATIRKFVSFRERRSGEYVSYTEQARRAGGASSSSSPRAVSTSNTVIPTESDATDMGLLAAYLGLFKTSSSNSLNSQEPSNNTNHEAVNTVTRQTSDQTAETELNAPSPATAGAAAAALLERVDAIDEAINAQATHIAHLRQLLRKQVKLHAALIQKADEIRAMLPPADRKRHFNAFMDRNIRNTCSTLYRMNVVTGDNRYGLSYIDVTGQRTLYNDGFNYNYTDNAGEEGVQLLTSLRNNSLNSLRNARGGKLLRQEGQATAKCNVYIPAAYASEDNCSSGYNSIMDHHRYKGYTYTAEDNRLCYADGSKYRQSSSGTGTDSASSTGGNKDDGYGTESTSAAERTGAGEGRRVALKPQMGGSGVPAGEGNSSTVAGGAGNRGAHRPSLVRMNGNGFSSSGNGGVGAGSSSSSGSSSNGGYHGQPSAYTDPQHSLTTTSNNGSSYGGPVGHPVAPMGGGTGVGVNPVTGFIEHYPAHSLESENDLELDLFAFFLDATSGDWNRAQR